MNDFDDGLATPIHADNTTCYYCRHVVSYAEDMCWWCKLYDRKTSDTDTCKDFKE